MSVPDRNNRTLNFHYEPDWYVILSCKVVSASSASPSSGRKYCIFVEQVIIVIFESQICINIHPDAVPPIHAESYHVATDKVPAKDGDKFRSIFSDNLQPIATRGKKARSTLLVDQQCGNGCSIKRAPLSVSYYNEISGGHIWRGVVWRRCSAGPVLPLCVE